MAAICVLNKAAHERTVLKIIVEIHKYTSEQSGAEAAL